MDDRPFTADQGYAAQKALRASLDMGPARFSLPDLARMLGDEIEAHRKAGHDWDAIAETISEATGQPVEAAALREHSEGGQRG